MFSTILYLLQQVQFLLFFHDSFTWALLLLHMLALGTMCVDSRCLSMLGSSIFWSEPVQYLGRALNLSPENW